MSSTETPASTTPAPVLSEARLRSDARKAKIQARGEKGLAKLANTARGAEGAKMYETTVSTPKSTRPSQSLTTSPSPPSLAPDNPFASPFPSAGLGTAGEDPFAMMIKAMQEGAGGPGGLPGGAPGDDPFAAFGGGGFGGASSPFGGMMGGGMPGASGAGQDFTYSNKKTLSDKLFTLAHFLGVLGLVAFVVGWWEPRVLEKQAGLRGLTEVGGFAGEGGVKGVWGGKGTGAELPVFWAFVTLSLILQTTRLLLFRSRPPPSSLLSLVSPFLAFIPPNFKHYLFTASRYISMLTQFAQDLSVMVFAFGVARWVQGAPGSHGVGGGALKEV